MALYITFIPARDTARAHRQDIGGECEGAGPTPTLPIRGWLQAVELGHLNSHKDNVELPRDRVHSPPQFPQRPPAVRAPSMPPTC